MERRRYSLVSVDEFLGTRCMLKIYCEMVLRMRSLPLELIWTHYSARSEGKVKCELPITVLCN